MNREIVFSSMRALQLDPISIFEKRELSHPILFTSSVKGTDLETCVEERANFNKWFNLEYYGLENCIDDVENAPFRTRGV